LIADYFSSLGRSSNRFFKRERASDSAFSAFARASSFHNVFRRRVFAFDKRFLGTGIVEE